MFGFVIGIACLWGLVRVVRGGRRGYGPWAMRDHGCSGGYRSRRRRRGWHDDEDDWGRHAGGGFFMRQMFERLDTSPGQEKEIKAAIGDVMDAGRALKNDVSGSREDVAAAFRTDDFNEELMASLLTRHDERIDAVRTATVAGLAKIHATLDPDQRKHLARMLERGPRWGGGPYRHAGV